MRWYSCMACSVAGHRDLRFLFIPIRTCRHWNNEFMLPVMSIGCKMAYLNVCSSRCRDVYLHTLRPVGAISNTSSNGPLMTTCALHCTVQESVLIVDWRWAAVVGVTVNCMAFAVLSTTALSGSSLSVYLRALAVTDNCALVFNVAISFARAHLPALAGLFKTHEWLCALNKVLLGVSFYYSTWLVVSLTWERLATITYPLTLGVWCNKKVAMMVVCTLGVLSFMVGVVRVKYSGFEQDSVFEFEPCSVHTGLSLTPALYGYIALSIWLPLVLIVVGNLCLVATLRRSARTRSALTGKLQSCCTYPHAHSCRV
ncbi:hypothetical protein PR048_008882 [Dryococelus australis]|uniref:G-protein coupled receptors family 1 profile domain-containing protein n=1 Tax=Dryococelus australis TaxID=614101 RepID=A0ABQ9HYC2_9NEOP|nr:hypothetical protein PR048_008882 [Dryococelus australis]